MAKSIEKLLRKHYKIILITSNFSLSELKLKSYTKYLANACLPDRQGFEKELLNNSKVLMENAQNQNLPNLGNPQSEVASPPQPPTQSEQSVSMTTPPPHQTPPVEPPQPQPSTPPEEEAKKKGLTFMLVFIIIVVGIFVGGYLVLTKLPNLVSPIISPQPSPTISIPSPSPAQELEEISDSLEDEDIQSELDQTQIGEESKDLEKIDQDLDQL